MHKKRILVLTTGGTIEKSYSEEDGSIVNRESIFKEKLLRRLRLPHTIVEVEQVMAKDSLEMNEKDREAILAKISDAMTRYDGLVVLHGTDTLNKTVKLCLGHLPVPKVPVVFTGAMRPAGFEDSDAQQNFTEALFAAGFLQPGFYLAFHGYLFSHGRFAKDINKKTFVEI